VRTLADVIDQGAYLFVDGVVEPAPDAFEKHCTVPDTHVRLEAVRAALAAVKEFDAAHVESAIRELAERTGVKAASYIHPLRVALTGQSVSPGIFEVLALIGHDIALERIDALIAKVRLTGAQAS
jgi:nondiscriminating glutamyl-tRNA synthetase